jgi:uncharacterized membrane protein YeaQ/YmgE (transglycosylase-associated protein family)
MEQQIAFMVIGLLTGLLCRLIVPTPPRMGGFRMPLIGMVGGLFGGLVGGTLQPGMEKMTLAIPSIIGSFIGALVAVFGVLLLSRNRAHV